VIRSTWFVAGVAAFIGVVIALFGAFSGDYSPRQYVAANFTRYPAGDLGPDARAYTSPLPPSLVAQRIAEAWAPADEYADGSGVYLRYSKDTVVIKPRAGGSLILVEGLRTAYPRYHGAVGNYWGWGRENSLRGGGPGAGK
jgi:hypothetical protein